MNKYFDEYVFKYDMNDPDINYKYYHSYRVMDAMELLSNELKLSSNDIHLAKVIGLLHDIGRFEQDKLYNSFKDGKFDHGNYGVEILKQTNLLDNFNINKEDYEVVYKAIDNHNQYQINTGLTERELFFSKMIRDADKLDILNALGNEKIKPILRQDDEEINSNLKLSFFNHIPGNTKEVISKNDALIITFSYIYDINFKETYKIINKEKYYEKIFNRINRKDIFNPYIEYTNNYIKERIN